MRTILAALALTAVSAWEEEITLVVVEYLDKGLLVEVQEILES